MNKKNMTIVLAFVAAVVVVAILFASCGPSISAAPVPVNVKDYGAIGDGIHDDGPAILAAIAASGGGRVTFPLGYYYVRDVSKLPSGWPLSNWAGEGTHAIPEVSQQSCIKYTTIEKGPTYDDAGKVMIPAGKQSLATHFRFILTPGSI